ncbi:AAA-like domain-containing protein [Nostoc sp. UHCC 0870]|uniref:AAA-like domain-containing protein n=1 Tax=Nostoc sp. UHCC 0870 TaxID=2914041 RepID=UPI001EDCAADF|nr:AAA-like domain-containing protein [Nostoc sp. UHCC 0870]UKO97295.1 AAA-like domain-containing protein [Nostoc sp. UHCC 0870]
MTYTNDSQIRILFLTAEPTDTAKLRLGQELREIKQKLQQSQHRERFQLEYVLSARSGDVSQELLKFEPHIVHFSGHGASTGELCFEDGLGKVQSVKPQALAALFELVADQVQCVLLNACYSVTQAEAIAKYIPFVIGMNTAIGDQAAIAFAVGFYKALGANHSPEKAFKFGCAEIGLEGIPEELTPVLYQKTVQQSPDGFYVERPPIEQQCYEEIRQQGALIRIKAPDKMGKTSLMNRILTYARANNYQTVTLSCRGLIDRQLATDMEKFLQSFCAAVSKELGLTNQVHEYWDNRVTPIYNSSEYFKKYLLPNTTNELVLALNDVDLIFEHNEISQDFCSLLRSFYDMARRGDPNNRIWERLRLIIVHSTEVYASLDINSSPLANVGLIVDLPEFNQKQVQCLVKLYGLKWNTNQVDKLMAMVGGHPYLLRTAINNIKSKKKNLDKFLAEASTLSGAYRDHLQELLETLENSPELRMAFIQVISADENNPVRLHPRISRSLQRLGLVNLHGNFAKPRCELYRLYFRAFL